MFVPAENQGLVKTIEDSLGRVHLSAGPTGRQMSKLDDKETLPILSHALFRPDAKYNKQWTILGPAKTFALGRDPKQQTISYSSLGSRPCAQCKNIRPRPESLKLLKQTGLQ